MSGGDPCILCAAPKIKIYFNGGGQECPPHTFSPTPTSAER